MSTTGLRALIALVNLALMGLIAWSGYLTFFYLDEERWQVEAPVEDVYTPPRDVQNDLTRERKLYDTIVDVFHYQAPPKPPSEAKPPPIATPKVEKPPPGMMQSLQLTTLFYNRRNPARSTAWLQAPGAGERTFMVGMNIDDYPEFRSYKGVTLKEVTATEAVLEDASGKELRLAAPAGSGK
ncbi:hypothetical protein ACFL59_06200 [Planctomycetota bacterium]